MDGEAHFLIGDRRSTFRLQDKTNVFIIIIISGTYLDGLDDRRIALEAELASIG